MRTRRTMEASPCHLGCVIIADVEDCAIGLSVRFQSRNFVLLLVKNRSEFLVDQAV